MTVGTLQINGRKFRVISEDDYKTLRAAMRARRQRDDENARDPAIARRRLKDPKTQGYSSGPFQSRSGALILSLIHIFHQGLQKWAWPSWSGVSIERSLLVRERGADNSPIVRCSMKG